MFFAGAPTIGNKIENFKFKTLRWLRAPRCGSGPNCPLEAPAIRGGPLPSSHSPSLPSSPIFPTPLALFAMLRQGRPGLARGEAAHWGGGAGASKRHLGPDPHLGAFEVASPKVVFDTVRNIKKISGNVHQD